MKTVLGYVFATSWTLFISSCGVCGFTYHIFHKNEHILSILHMLWHLWLVTFWVIMCEAPLPSKGERGRSLNMMVCKDNCNILASLHTRNILYLFLHVLFLHLNYLFILWVFTPYISWFSCFSLIEHVSSALPWFIMHPCVVIDWWIIMCDGDHMPAWGRGVEHDNALVMVFTEEIAYLYCILYIAFGIHELSFSWTISLGCNNLTSVFHTPGTFNVPSMSNVTGIPGSNSGKGKEVVLG